MARSNTRKMLAGAAGAAAMVLMAIALYVAVSSVNAPAPAPEAAPAPSKTPDEVPKKAARDDAPGIIKGRAVHDGKPVAGARLSLAHMERGGEVEDVDAVTDAAGEFSVESSPGRIRVLVEADGYALGESREIKLTAGRVLSGIEIDLTERGAILVQVEDEDGNPIPGAQVVPVGLFAWQSKGIQTNETGAAKLDGVPVGPLKIRVWAHRYSEVLTDPLEVVPGGAISTRVVLPSLGGIMGRVESPLGGGVKWAQVSISPLGKGSSVDTAQTGTGGRFRFEGLEAGRYELRAAHPRFGPSVPMIVEANAEEPAVLVLTAGGSITGQVRRGDGGVYDGKFSVVIERYVPDESGVVVQDGQTLGPRHFRNGTYTDDEGQFRFDGLGSGTYDIFVDAEDHGPGRAEGVRVFNGEETRGVRIDLSEGTVLAGRVIDAETREPLPLAQVMVQDSERRSRNLRGRSALTDESGEYVIGGVMPGRRSLRVRLRGYQSKMIDGVEVVDGGVRDMEITLSALSEGDGPRTEYSGIGATLRITRDGALQVQKMMEGAPSERFGLKINDEILTIDGQDVRNLGFGRSVELIRGEEGAAVELEVRRKGESHPLMIELERGKVIYRPSPGH